MHRIRSYSQGRDYLFCLHWCLWIRGNHNAMWSPAGINPWFPFVWSFSDTFRHTRQVNTSMQMIPWSIWLATKWFLLIHYICVLKKWRPTQISFNSVYMGIKNVRLHLFFFSFLFAGALKTDVKYLGIMMVDNLSFANHILPLATSS